jgi:p-aminobenzoyl-glutamate transporter AbgT
MKNKKKTKTKFWKTLSFFILIIFVIKLVGKFIKEHVIKYKVGSLDDFQEEDEVELSEEDKQEDQQ